MKETLTRDDRDLTAVRVYCVTRRADVNIDECRRCVWLIDVDERREQPVRCRPADPHGRVVL